MTRSDVTAAWAEFEQQLTDHLLSMTDPDSMVIEVRVDEDPQDGVSPYVQFAGFGGDHLRAEVSGNRYLAPLFRLSAEDIEELERNGWEDGEHNLFVHAPTADSARLARMAVQALREVFRVRHPSGLLSVDPQGEERLALGAADRGDRDSDVGEPLAVMPSSLEHLGQLVDEAMQQVLGHPPHKDDDGDIPVPGASTVVFVHVADDAPVVELFSPVVSGAQDLEAVATTIEQLNGEWPFIKFVRQGNSVWAHLHISCMPFAAMNLTAMLEYMSTTLEDIGGEVAALTGGMPALDPAEWGGSAPVAASESGSSTGLVSSTAGPSARAAVADFWDGVLAEWVAGRRDVAPPLDEWVRSYKGTGPGAVDLEHYPDPYVGDLRGLHGEPRLVFLGLNPGIGYDVLQGADGLWTQRIADVSYSHCFERSPEDDQESWIRLHGKRSTYWRNIIGFTRRWLHDENAGMPDILNFELYPWHSAKIVGSMKPPADLLEKFVWEPVKEVPVSEVFAFGKVWFDVCRELELEEVAYFGPDADPVPGSDMWHWRLGLFRLPSDQLVVVSSQMGYAGPPGKAGVEIMRNVVEEHRRTNRTRRTR